MRWLTIAAGIVLLVFGLLCLNYTKASALERHRAFAQEHQLPEPGNAILFGGIVSVSFGSALIGYALGSRTRQRAATALPSPTSIKSD
jgi:cytochrome c biogenesis protein CcdA